LVKLHIQQVKYRPKSIRFSLNKIKREFFDLVPTIDGTTKTIKEHWGIDVQILDFAQLPQRCRDEEFEMNEQMRLNAHLFANEISEYVLLHGLRHTHPQLSIEFLHKLFESAKIYNECTPWEKIDPRKNPLRIAITCPSLNNGQTFHKIINISGKTHYNSRGMFVFDTVQEHDTYLSNPTRLPMLCSLQYDRAEQLCLDDVEDIEEFGLPITKQRDGAGNPTFFSYDTKFFLNPTLYRPVTLPLDIIYFLEIAARSTARFIDACFGLSASGESMLNALDPQPVPDSFFENVTVQFSFDEGLPLEVLNKSPFLTVLNQHLNVHKEETNNLECVLCHRPKSILSNIFKCSKCKKVYYCSKECQRVHWIEGHKYVCK
jgi:hypothetical protein